MRFNWILRLMAFYRFGIAGEGGGAAVDRGDDFTPTGPDATGDGEPAASKAAAEKLTAELEAEKAAKDAADAEAAAAAAAAGNDEVDDDDENASAEAKAAKKAKKDTRVPLARHEALLKKERDERERVERELNALKVGQEVAKTNERLTEAENQLVKLETEYSKLLTDGEAAQAAAKMTEIRKLERSIIQSKAAMETQAAEARAVDRVRYDTTLERLEDAFPAINPDHADYDQAQAAEVIELRDAYIATGKFSRADALKKAAKVLLGAGNTRQERAVDTEVRVDKDAVAKAAAEERRLAQIKKNADAAAKQPPNSDKVGQDHDKMGGKLDHKKVMSMKYEEFAKLSDADLAELRGDTV